MYVFGIGEIFWAVLVFVAIHYWRLNRNTPITKWPVLGMLPGLLHNVSNIHGYVDITLKQNGGTFLFEGPWLTNMNMVCTSDPKNVQHITSTRFENYGKGNDFREIFEVLGEGIFRSDSHIWKYNRKLLHSIFKQENFQVFIQKTVEKKICNYLLVFLDHASKNGVQVDLQDIFQRLTFDNICSVVLGFDPKCLSIDLPEIPCERAFTLAEDTLFISDYRELSHPFTTKIGGLPDWPLPKDAINTDLLRCATCANSLSLVAQVYAPLSHHHRILFIFGCVSPKCTTVWRVLRLQKLADVDISQHKQQVEVQNSNSRDDEDESQDEDGMSFEELAEALFQAGTLASSNSKSKSKKQQKKRQHKFPTSSPYPEPTTASEDVDNRNDVSVVPCFYIYTQEEPSTGGLNSVCSSYSSLSIKENGNSVEDNMQAEETWEKEQYEYDKALTADRTYLKFKKRLDAHPEQCFRYSYGGKPILAVADEINPGSCGLCGRPRQFEMQLMPPLLYFLQEALDDNQRQMVENWDWMTLLVYTCPESCCEEIKQVKSNSEGWIIAEEAVVAQCEESMPTQLGYFS